MKLIDLDKAMSICDEDNNAVIFANTKNAEIKAIPVEWIEKYAKRTSKKCCHCATAIWEMLEDWEKENGID